MIKVGVNGYGTIGKRVAEAILMQDDMRLVGVSKTKPDYGAKIAERKGIPVYSVFDEKIPLFESRGIDVCGSVEDLVKTSDIVVDCSPAGIGVKNKEIYERHGKKAIFEGGEKKDVADITFVAQCNYKKAMGRSYVKVASCNTTALCRTLDFIDKGFGIKNSFVTIARRAVDPHESNKGPIDAVIPNSLDLPTHHAYDVKEVLPNINIFTVSMKIPTKMMHVQVVMAELREETSREEVVDLLEGCNRNLLIERCDGFESTSQIIEMSRDIGRKRHDIWETVIWEDSVTVNDGRLYLIQAVHQEAIVIPENIDAIRASFGLCDGDSSIQKTNEALGIMASRF